MSGTLQLLTLTSILILFLVMKAPITEEERDPDLEVLYHRHLARHFITDFFFSIANLI